MAEALQVVANRLSSGEATSLRISASGASFTILDPEIEQDSVGPQSKEDEEQVCVCVLSFHGAGP
jgi:hypothetical protein